MPAPDFVRDQLNRLGVTVSDEQLDALARFLDLLLEHNTRVNLTSIREPDQAWQRHVVDSLTLVPGFEDVPEGAKVIDVGSGGGLPGLPLAIALPHLRFTLLEATGKKARFIQSAAEALGLGNVQVLNDRAEKAGQDKRHRERYDVAVCRALGPMRELLEYTLPLVKIGGFLLAMKGPSVEQELEAAGDAMSALGGGELAVIDAYPEGFDNRSVIVRVEKAQTTPRAYPRSPGTPRHDPL